MKHIATSLLLLGCLVACSDEADRKPEKPVEKGFSIGDRVSNEMAPQSTAPTARPD